ncbi:hypothetical protein HDF16_004950 [Granulicella aggregans]|uniref:Uncharacterized protein n=1 Tax=Granulicella aggregans TaxID=474949 RepID=A0A7W8E6E0_9BACT|nr:hypothetical protein [Granulicella aggregans]MBB5060214.1 hypothetical protein [Granulicella aggregans]
MRPKINPDLTTYLHDHLAGANAAVEVIALLQKHLEELVLINFLNSLLIEVQQDKLTLETIFLSLGLGPSIIKDGAAWVSSRVVSLKVRGGKTVFGAFEGLEFLSLGIQGKLHLWKALERSAACGGVQAKPDFRLLIERLRHNIRMLKIFALPSRLSLYKGYLAKKSSHRNQGSQHFPRSATRLREGRIQ